MLFCFQPVIFVYKDSNPGNLCDSESTQWVWFESESPDVFDFDSSRDSVQKGRVEKAGNVRQRLRFPIVHWHDDLTNIHQEMII